MPTYWINNFGAAYRVRCVLADTGNDILWIVKHFTKPPWYYVSK
jgi:hypothetical protein